MAKTHKKQIVLTSTAMEWTNIQNASPEKVSPLDPLELVL